MARTQIKSPQISPTIAHNVVATLESTGSTSFVDLTTVQSVTINVPASGNVLLGLNLSCGANTVGAYLLGAYAMSGANTAVATDTTAVYWRANTVLSNAGENSISKTFLITGLTPGSTTFTFKFRTTTGTAYFERREIWAEAK
jgi:hypothetical protein